MNASAATGRAALVVSVGVRSPAGATARLGVLGLRADAVASGTVELDEDVAVRPAAPIDDAPLAERLFALAAPALAEARLGAESLGVPLWLVAPAALLAERAQAEVLAELAGRAGVALDRANSAVLGADEGRGFVVAVARAIEWLARADGPRQLVIGAVDSMLERARLEALYEERRVRPVGAPRQPAGSLVPSEGAAFLVLGRESDDDGSALARISVSGGAPVDAPGLSLAASSLLGLADGAAELTLVSDDNGEVSRGRAWSRLLVEIGTKLGASAPTIAEWPIAQALGDADGATPALAAGLVAASMSVGIVGVPRVLIAALRDGALVGLSLEPRQSTVVLAPSRTVEPSRASREARIALRVVEGLWRRFRRVQHRIAPARRKPLAKALSEVASSLVALEESIVDPGSLARVEGLRAELASLSASAEQAKLSASRRGQEVEPIVIEALELSKELVTLVESMRGELVDELARAVEPPAVELDMALPLPLSSGVPRLYPFEVDVAARGQGARLEPADDADVEEEEDDEALEEGAALREAPVVAAESDPAELAACLDSIGRGFRVRSPMGDGLWSPALADVDERILGELDRIYGLAAPLARRAAAGSVLSGLALDPLPLLRAAVDPSDPGRAFADTLALACATDPRLVRAAVSKARGLHPDAYDAVVSALSLGSSVRIGQFAAELCLEGDPLTVRAGLEVMRRRRAVSVAVALPSLHHPEPRLRASAAAALGHAESRDAAVSVLESRLAVESTAEVQLSLLEALVRLGAPHAEAHAARLAREQLALGDTRDAETRRLRLGFMRVSAALGRVDELARFTELAREPLELECLGWFGRVVSVDPLIQVLERPLDEEPLARAAARALQRILGLVPASTGRGLELRRGELATVVDDELVLQPAPWRRAWAAQGGDFSVGARYRFGRRLEPGVVRREHLASGVRVRDRRMTALELACAGPGRFAPADEDDWIARQLAAMPEA